MDLIGIGALSTVPPEMLISAFATLLVAIDPLGLAPIFAGLTDGLSARQKRTIAFTATALAFAILAVFTIFGEQFLRALGVALPAFRIAGGLLLFYTAFEMVFERREERKRDTADRTREQLSSQDRNLAAFPLAIPLMAGPGAITACILLAADMGTTTAGLSTLIAIIAVICLLCLIGFLAAGFLTRLLGDLGRTVLTRLLGVILAALAVQFVADGVRGFIAGG